MFYVKCWKEIEINGINCKELVRTITVPFEQEEDLYIVVNTLKQEYFLEVVDNLGNAVPIEPQEQVDYRYF